MRWPHNILADWVMDSYDGFFPRTTRKLVVIQGACLEVALAVVAVVLLVVVCA